MRVSAGELPNSTTRSECASASLNDDALTLSYGEKTLPFFLSEPNM